MKILIFFLFFCQIFYAKDFLTKYEYAKLLYTEPQGVGCDKCHGIYGEGVFLGSYHNKKGIEVIVHTKPIYNLSKEEFITKMNQEQIFMPKYSLSKDELVLIYEYLQNIKGDQFGKKTKKKKK